MRMFKLLVWLAEWRDDQFTLTEQVADPDIRFALEGELAELGERLTAEETVVREALRASGEAP